jgi:hypothetical protein
MIWPVHREYQSLTDSEVVEATKRIASMMQKDILGVGPFSRRSR